MSGSAVLRVPFLAVVSVVATLLSSLPALAQPAPPEMPPVVTESQAPAGPAVEPAPGEGSPASQDTGAAAAAAERAVRYEDALSGGRDLVLQPTVDGWEEFVVLPDRASGDGYEVHLRLPAHVIARQAGANVVELVGRDGAMVALYGAGWRGTARSQPQRRS